MRESMRQADIKVLSRDTKFKWDLQGDYESHRQRAKEQSCWE